MLPSDDCSVFSSHCGQIRGIHIKKTICYKIFLDFCCVKLYINSLIVIVKHGIIVFQVTG